jgi:hypothetical protein
MDPEPSLEVGLASIKDYPPYPISRPKVITNMRQAARIIGVKLSRIASIDFRYLKILGPAAA